MFSFSNARLPGCLRGNSFSSVPIKNVMQSNMMRSECGSGRGCPALRWGWAAARSSWSTGLIGCSIFISKFKVQFSIHRFGVVKHRSILLQKKATRCVLCGAGLCPAFGGRLLPECALFRWRWCVFRCSVAVAF